MVLINLFSSFRVFLSFFPYFLFLFYQFEIAICSCDPDDFSWMALSPLGE